ncbi:MAG TPA: ABC transporter substrate-binding protein [Dehalococcoidia bacterium]|nr:ABC transporter substrate-binding protein [Dehalococcoidia bacterium]
MAEPGFWTAVQRRRLNRRQTLAGAAWGAAALAGAGTLACGNAKKVSQGAPSATNRGASETPKPGGNLSIFVQTNYPLDPQKVSALAQQIPGGAMSRIFKYKPSLEPATITNHDFEPDLGLSAESPDAITWTVKLRADAKFQNTPPVNGHAVEAEDIKATFTRALDPATSNPNRAALSMMDSAQIQTPDKSTVVFKLTYPYAPFRSILASPSYSWIFPREVLGGSWDPTKQVIGSGPFILDSVQPDVAFSYKRNPGYFGAPLPYADTMRVAITPDATQQLAQFAAGNLDEIEVRDPFSVPTVKLNNPKANMYKVLAGNAAPLYFQLGDPSSVFQDVRVRRAISMAIDRDVVAKAVYNGDGLNVVFVPGSMGKWSLKTQDLPADLQQYYKYNPAEAKKLLDAAGQSNLQIRFANPFFSLGSPDTAKAVEVINGMFTAIGIKSTIVNLNYNQDFVDAGKGMRQGYFDKDYIVFGNTSPYTDADDWLFSYFHSKSLSNGEHLNDKTLDAMIDKQRTLVNEDERVKAVQEIQRYLADKLYVPSTVGSYRYEFTQPRVRNYNFSDSLGKQTEMYAKIWLAG